MSCRLSEENYVQAQHTYEHFREPGWNVNDHQTLNVKSCNGVMLRCRYNVDSGHLHSDGMLCQVCALNQLMAVHANRLLLIFIASCYYLLSWHDQFNYVGNFRMNKNKPLEKLTCIYIYI